MSDLLLALKTLSVCLSQENYPGTLRQQGYWHTSTKKHCYVSSGRGIGVIAFIKPEPVLKLPVVQAVFKMAGMKIQKKKNDTCHILSSLKMNNEKLQHFAQNHTV